MDENVHIVWGNSSFSENRVNVLKKNGINKIYVLDNKMTSVVKEEDDVVYFSLKYAALLKRDAPGNVHHLFMYVEPGQKRKK